MMDHRGAISLIWLLAFSCYRLTLPAQANGGPPKALNLITPEIHYSFAKPGLEIRYRPIHVIFPYNVPQFHLMVGKVFWKGRFKAFNYNILDSQRHFWMGIRLDQNNWLFDRKLLLHWQVRYFHPMNSSTWPRAQCIQLLTYDLHAKWSSGILGYTTFNIHPQKDHSWFVGPCIIWKFDKVMSAFVSFNHSVPLGNKDKWFTKTWFFFWRITWRIKA